MHLFPPICFNLPISGSRFCIIAKFQFVNNISHTLVGFLACIMYSLIAFGVTLLGVDWDVQTVLLLSAVFASGHGLGKELAEGTCGQGFDILDLAFHGLGVAIFVFMVINLLFAFLASSLG